MSLLGFPSVSFPSQTRARKSRPAPQVPLDSAVPEQAAGSTVLSLPISNAQGATSIGERRATFCTHSENVSGLKVWP